MVLPSRCRNRYRPSGSRISAQPPSWHIVWCPAQGSAPLLTVVSPPSTQSRRWCPSAQADRAVAERHRAAVPVPGDHRLALRPGEEPLLPPQHARLTLPVDPDEGDIGITADPARGRPGDRTHPAQHPTRTRPIPLPGHRGSGPPGHQSPRCRSCPCAGRAGRPGAASCPGAGQRCLGQPDTPVQHRATTSSSAISTQSLASAAGVACRVSVSLSRSSLASVSCRWSVLAAAGRCSCRWGCARWSGWSRPG